MPRLGLKEAKDLVDNAPGLVLHRVTRERADRAKDLLESLGATVTVSATSPEPHTSANAG